MPVPVRVTLQVSDGEEAHRHCTLLTMQPAFCDAVALVACGRFSQLRHRVRNLAAVAASALWLVRCIGP